MWFDSDAFHFLWKEMHGDMVLHSRAAFVGDGVNPHRKMGVMIRESLDTSAAYVDVAVHGDGLTSMQFRREAGADTEEIQSAVTAPDMLVLRRDGNRFIMSVGPSPDSLISDTLPIFPLNDPVYVGLFICSHEEGVSETAIFHDVEVTEQ